MEQNEKPAMCRTIEEEPAAGIEAAGIRESADLRWTRSQGFAHRPVPATLATPVGAPPFFMGRPAELPGGFAPAPVRVGNANNQA